MKKLIATVCVLAFGALIFAETNANDTQSAIVNSLLIQQLMQMQNQNQQNGQMQQNAQASAAEEKPAKKKRIEDEDDLLEAGYKRFKLDEDSEDNFVFKTNKSDEFEVDMWAVNKRGKLGYYGSVLVNGKKGYKGNPLDEDLDNYRSVWLKVLNDENAIIKNLGEKHSDQYFEIQ